VHAAVSDVQSLLTYGNHIHKCYPSLTLSQAFVLSILRSEVRTTASFGDVSGTLACKRIKQLHNIQVLFIAVVNQDTTSPLGLGQVVAWQQWNASLLEQVLAQL
jgi:hypothetical protein